ncbi:hypothetical protein L249_5176, partial [Ophiocordyceps polyrhachis-furcata BCC 54312]
PEPESLAKEYFWSLPIVAERGNFFKKSKEEGGKKEVEMDKELTNREGDHVIEKKKRNHVMVGKPSFFYRQFLRNKDLYVRTLPRCKRCAQGGVGTD